MKKVYYGIRTENRNPILYYGTEKEAETLWNRMIEARNWNCENTNTEPPQNTLRAMTRVRCWYIYNGFEMSIETPEERIQRQLEEQQQQPQQPQTEQPQTEQTTETTKTHKKTPDTTDKRFKRIFAELARIKEDIAELQAKR